MKSKCFLQFINEAFTNKFLQEFNNPLTDSKGETFVPFAELAFYQEVCISCPNKTDIYNTPAFIKFKELLDSGNFLYEEEIQSPDVIERKSHLLAAIKNDAEEKKKEETKKTNKKWKNKNKKWTKK